MPATTKKRQQGEYCPELKVLKNQQGRSRREAGEKGREEDQSRKLREGRKGAC